jgi:hypothetical protein
MAATAAGIQKAATIQGVAFESASRTGFSKILTRSRGPDDGMRLLPGQARI